LYNTDGYAIKCRSLIGPSINQSTGVLVAGFIKRVRVMKFNTTFSNISVISWWPVLLEYLENH